MTIFLNILFLVIGMVLLIKGADFFVGGASAVAKRLKVPSIFIGLTIVAVGTSLPELVTSVVAAKKGESEIALGNVIGSNIFNILFILGASGIVHPLHCDIGALIDTIVLIVISALMFVIYKVKDKATRSIGYFSIAVYAAYVAYIILRAYNLLPSI